MRAVALNQALRAVPQFTKRKSSMLLAVGDQVKVVGEGDVRIVLECGQGRGGEQAFDATSCYSSGARRPIPFVSDVLRRECAVPTGSAVSQSQADS